MTTTATRELPTRTGEEARAGRRSLAFEQLFVIAGQGLAGAGNLAFALVAVHLLRPTQFAALATFLALYLLLFMPLTSLSAGSALDPALERRVRRRALVASGVVAAALAAAAVPVGRLLGLSPWLVGVLALSAPSAAWLPLARGRLYGEGALGGVVASLVGEPVVRLTLGVLLVVGLGSVGGATGVVLAGYAAVAVAYLGLRRSRRVLRPASPVGATSMATVATFVVLAVMQNQDLVLAKGILDAPQAALFAGLSTLGGIAAFATATVPLVLLPRVAERRRGALTVALTVAFVVGGAVVAGAALAPRGWYTTMFGRSYAALVTLAVPYLSAMALLGIARVLAAHRCARGRGRSTGLVILAAAALQAGLVVTEGTSAHGVALATLQASVVLIAVLAGATAADRMFAADRAVTATRQAASVATDTAAEAPLVQDVTEPVTPVEAPARTPWWRSTGFVVGLLTAAAAGIRLWIPRGLWLDEATSWLEATQPYHRMLQILRQTDVHPPGYLSVLWTDVRVFGQSELALRLPSIVAGVVLVPVLYVVGRDLYDRRAGLAAAAFGVVAPQMVWYSQDARMYAFFQLFAVLAVWLQVLAVRRGRWWHWLGYALTSAAMLYTQYFTVLVVAVQQLAFLAVAVSRLRRRRQVLRYLAGWLLSAALVAALVVPLVPFAVDQFVNNQNAGKGFGAPAAAGASPGPLSYYTVVANLIWGVWGYHSTSVMQLLGALWPLGLLLILLLLGRGRSRTSTLLVAVAFVPAAVLYVVGLDKRFLFDLRYFSALVPVTVLLFARGASSWAASRTGRTVVATVLIGTMAWGTVDEQLNHANPRVYDFRGALSFVTRHSRGNELLLYAPNDLNNLSKYYAPKVPARAASASALRPAMGRRVFVLASFLNQPGTRKALDAVLPPLRRHRHLADVFSSANVRVWEFT